MIVCDNGVYREATEEEIEAWANTPEPEDAEEILSILLGGDSE